VPSFHPVSLTHQRLVANIVLHLLLSGEQSCEKAGVHVTELFRASNRMSAEKEEIETEMTKSYRCLESRRLTQKLPKKAQITSKISGREIQECGMW